MSYANDIDGKLEDSCVAMLQAAVVAGTLTIVASGSILPAVDNGDVPLPRVVCRCDSARVEEVFDGNWDADLDVEVIAAAADTTRQQFRDICAEVFAHFFLDHNTVNTNLSNATVAFTAFAVYPRTKTKQLFSGEDGDEWHSTLKVSVKCCGSNVA